MKQVLKNVIITYLTIYLFYQAYYYNCELGKKCLHLNIYTHIFICEPDKKKK